MRRLRPRTRSGDGLLLMRRLGVAVAVLAAAATAGPLHAVDFLYSWPPSSVVGLTGYGIYQSTDGGSYQLIAQIPLGALPNPQQPSYLVTGLQDDTTYYFASAALATTGDGPLSFQTCIAIDTDVVACGTDDDGGSYVFINCFISAATPRP